MRTVLLTLLTLSLFVIAIVEVSGISRNALFNPDRRDDDYYYYGERYDGRRRALPRSEGDERLDQAHSMRQTTVAFRDTIHHFGSVEEGASVRYNYHFKNTGKNPLLIAKVDATCGCTILSFPKEPLQPGSEGDVTIQFNSENRTGRQAKSVLMYSNATKETIPLSFTADVYPGVSNPNLNTTAPAGGDTVAAR